VEKEMIVRRVLFAACGASLFLLAAAAPPVPAPRKPTQAQIARIKSLTEAVGGCHRLTAVPLAAGEGEVDAIVAETSLACEDRVQALQTQLSKYIGASAAEETIRARRPLWREGIRRIVAAHRAGH
jgi:hypothetical protein